MKAKDREAELRLDNAEKEPEIHTPDKAKIAQPASNAPTATVHKPTDTSANSKTAQTTAESTVARPRPQANKVRPGAVNKMTNRRPSRKPGRPNPNRPMPPKKGKKGKGAKIGVGVLGLLGLGIGGYAVIHHGAPQNVTKSSSSASDSDSGSLGFNDHKGKKSSGSHKGKNSTEDKLNGILGDSSSSSHKSSGSSSGKASSSDLDTLFNAGGSSGGLKALEAAAANTAKATSDLGGGSSASTGNDVSSGAGNHVVEAATLNNGHSGAVISGSVKAVKDVANTVPVHTSTSVPSNATKPAPVVVHHPTGTATITTPAAEDHSSAPATKPSHSNSTSGSKTTPTDNSNKGTDTNKGSGTTGKTTGNNTDSNTGDNKGSSTTDSSGKTDNKGTANNKGGTTTGDNAGKTTGDSKGSTSTGDNTGNTTGDDKGSSDISKNTNTGKQDPNKTQASKDPWPDVKENTNSGAITSSGTVKSGETQSIVHDFKVNGNTVNAKDGTPIGENKYSGTGEVDEHIDLTDKNGKAIALNKKVNVVADGKSEDPDATTAVTNKIILKDQTINKEDPYIPFTETSTQNGQKRIYQATVDLPDTGDYLATWRFGNTGFEQTVHVK